MVPVHLTEETQSGIKPTTSTHEEKRSTTQPLLRFLQLLFKMESANFEKNER